MSADRILMLKLLGDTSSIDRSLKGTTSRMARLGGAVKSWGTALALDAAISGLQGLGDELSNAWDGFREGEKAAGQLGTTWKNLGLDGDGLDRTIQRISDQAKSLGVDDTESIRAFNQALQATGGKPKQAMDRLRIAQDLVANGSAPNLKAAMGIVAQASKGSSKTVDKFGLTSKTAAGRVAELGEKVKGAAKKAADLDPVGKTVNDVREDFEGIVGSLSKGDLEGAFASLGQIGTDVGAGWSKVYGPISETLDKLSGGAFSGVASTIGGIFDKLSSAGQDILPKLREGFEKLQAVWDALAPHVTNAIDAIQPLIDIASNAGAGTLGFVLDSVNGALDAIAKLLTGDFAGAFTSVQETVGKLGEDLGRIFGDLPGKITGEWLPAIGEAAGKVGQEILNKVLESPGLIGTWLAGILTGEDGIVGKLGGALEAVGAAAGDVGGRILSGVMDAAGTLGAAVWEAVAGEDGIVGMLSRAVDAVTTAAGTVGAAIFDGITGALAGLANAIVAPVRDGLNAVIDTWNAVNQVHVPEIVLFDALGRRDTFGPMDIGLPDIPRLAEGAIVSSPTLALIGEGRSPEAVVPLDGRHGLGGDTVHVTINAGIGDPIAIGREVERVLDAWGRRSGRRLAYGRAG